MGAEQSKDGVKAGLLYQAVVNSKACSIAERQARSCAGAAATPSGGDPPPSTPPPPSMRSLAAAAGASTRVGRRTRGQGHALARACTQHAPLPLAAASLAGGCWGAGCRRARSPCPADGGASSQPTARAAQRAPALTIASPLHVVMSPSDSTSRPSLGSLYHFAVAEGIPPPSPARRAGAPPLVLAGPLLAAARPAVRRGAQSRGAAAAPLSVSLQRGGVV